MSSTASETGKKNYQFGRGGRHLKMSHEELPEQQKEEEYE
jgi:hypothetical protein